MTTTKLILIIAVCAVCTMLTRAIPFLVFRDAEKVPKIILYLGKVLPPAVIATLVIYALRNTDVLAGTHGIPELIGVLCAGVLHWIWRNSFISIGVATVLYMILLRIM
ncbi:MAG: branched-chain amino acid transporter AzlD [Ruminococcaceae bacterium]|nr:branched-chain amino acid transporter AzlD [Oscillospiraceae bacterium]